MESSGTVHNCIKNVVLSAFEGEELELRLISPVKTKPDTFTFSRMPQDARSKVSMGTDKEETKKRS